LSFAAGALITALTFELFEDAYERGGAWRAGIGLFVGAVVFTALSALLDRWAQAGSKPVPADEYRGSPKLDTDAAAQGMRRPPRPPAVRRAWLCWLPPRWMECRRTSLWAFRWVSGPAASRCWPRSSSPIC